MKFFQARNKLIAKCLNCGNICLVKYLWLQCLDTIMRTIRICRRCFWNARISHDRVTVPIYMTVIMQHRTLKLYALDSFDMRNLRQTSKFVMALKYIQNTKRVGVLLSSQSLDVAISQFEIRWFKSWGALSFVFKHAYPFVYSIS